MLQSNIVNKENTMAKSKQVLKILNDAISLSVGPFGSTTIIQGKSLDHHMTKDGYTILKNIFFNDSVANTFLTIIQDASAALVTEVGDGSSATILSAYQLFESLEPLVNESLESDMGKVRPKLLLDKINTCITDITERIKDFTNYIDNSDLSPLEHIATVSLNNNPVVGKLVKNMYSEIGTEGFITVKLGNTQKTTYKRVDGFQISVGYFDKIFANNFSSESVLDHSLVMMFSATIGRDEMEVIIKSLFDYVNPQSENGKYRSFTVIAPGFDNFAKQQISIINNYYVQKNTKKNYNFIEYKCRDQFDTDVYYDLSAMLGADIIKNDIPGTVTGTFLQEKVEILDPLDTIKPMGGHASKKDEKKDEEDKREVNITSLLSYCGFAGSITSDEKQTTFFDTIDENVEQTKEIKGDIQKQLDDMKRDNIIDAKLSYSLNKRLAMLNKKLITVFVGGNSEHERATNKDLIDDAIAACKSALANGYVIGGNLSIVLAINKLLENLNESAGQDALYKRILEAISEAFKNVYREVLIKSSHSDEEVDEIIDQSIKSQAVYDLIKESYTQTNIINSSKTEVCILQNVLSIISLILTSNQFLEVNTNTPEE